jgi:hypothetical protein
LFANKEGRELLEFLRGDWKDPSRTKEVRVV